MTNLGFHRLMDERGIRVVTTDVGDRYVLEALRREGGVLGGEQSGHVIYLRDHVTGDGLAAALLLCAALEGRTLAEAAAVMPRFPQVKENVAVRAQELAEPCSREVEELNAELDGEGRVLVRPSGTEPVVRVLAEAETEAEARDLCGSIAALVQRELGWALPTYGDPEAGLSCVSDEGFRRRQRDQEERRMCGIIGYVGSRECKPLLLAGPRAARVPRLRLGRHRPARGRRARVRPRRRQPRHLKEAAAAPNGSPATHRARPHALGDPRRRHRARTRIH